MSSSSYKRCFSHYLKQNSEHSKYFHQIEWPLAESTQFLRKQAVPYSFYNGAYLNSSQTLEY